MDKTNGPAALPESRLYTFIDEDRVYALYFLEGQKLVHDLAVLHPVQQAGFSYFRDVVLSVQPMIALLKHGEQFGFYIDSDGPEFRLKIETGHAGATRATLLPEGFREFPAALHGVVRVMKLFPNNKAPYESIIHADGMSLRAMVNRVLDNSYQVNSKVLVSEQSDQSVMLHQLPPIGGREDYDYSLEAVGKRWDGLESGVEGLMGRGLTDPAEIVEAFAEIGFRRIAEREVLFRCPCTRERFVQALALLNDKDRADLFEPGRDALEVTCEYCKRPYTITRGDVESSGNPMH